MSDAFLLGQQIGKKDGYLILSAYNIVLNDENPTATIAVTRPGDGKITAVSSNTSLATVTVSGTTLTIEGVTGTVGEATITVSVAEGTNYTAPASKTITVSVWFKAIASTSATDEVSYISGLSGLSADEVSLFAEAISNNSSITNETSTVYIDFDSVHRKLSVGDQISLSLNGTSYAFDIIGFNHDTLTTSTIYGASTATGKAGITLQMHDLYATGYGMNTYSTNSGGWESSLMRTSTMATMKSYLPSTWQSVIKPVNKASGISSNSIGTVSDSCFLLAVVEVFTYGGNYTPTPGEGTRYAYYKAGNSPRKNKNGSASSWWMRSPYYNNMNSFFYVHTENDTCYSSTTVAYYGLGVAFGFCV